METLIYWNSSIAAVPRFLAYIIRCAVTAVSQVGDKVRFGVMLLFPRHGWDPGARWEAQATVRPPSGRLGPPRTSQLRVSSGGQRAVLRRQEVVTWSGASRGQPSVLSFLPTSQTCRHWRGIGRGRVPPVVAERSLSGERNRSRLFYFALCWVRHFTPHGCFTKSLVRVYAVSFGGCLYVKARSF